MADWFESRTFSDWVGFLSLVVTCFTAIVAIVIAWLALKHTAKPRIEIRLLSPSRLICDMEHSFVFEFSNVGHCYAQPSATDMRVFCNFPAEFKPLSIRYGSIQDEEAKEVKTGKGGAKYLMATGMELNYEEPPEHVHVVARTPPSGGEYLIRVVARPANGDACVRYFPIRCVGKDG